jgi:hypothetical protein
MAYKHKPQQIIKLLPPFNIELTLLHKPPRTLINSNPSITSMPTLNRKPNFVGSQKNRPVKVKVKVTL